MQARNLRRLSNGWIDCIINHPVYGWIPHTSAPGDKTWPILSARDDIAPYDGPDLSDARASASITRTAFCLGLKRAGILSPADAVTAAKGDWPDTFTAALDALPGEIDRDEAQIVWAAVTEIMRMDPVLLAMQAHLGLSDEQVDELFGIMA